MRLGALRRLFRQRGKHIRRGFSALASPRPAFPGRIVVNNLPFSALRTVWRAGHNVRLVFTYLKEIHHAE